MLMPFLSGTLRAAAIFITRHAERRYDILLPLLLMPPPCLPLLIFAALRCHAMLMLAADSFACFSARCHAMPIRCRCRLRYASYAMHSAAADAATLRRCFSPPPDDSRCR